MKFLPFLLLAACATQSPLTCDKIDWWAEHARASGVVSQWDYGVVPYTTLRQYAISDVQRGREECR